MSSATTFEDRNPAVFSSTYTIAPAAVPEPAYAVLVPLLLTAIIVRQQLISRTDMRPPNLT